MMEGINWEEVISQANHVQLYLNGFGNTFGCITSHFGGELSQLWASGNAVAFGTKLIEKEKELEDLEKSSRELFVNYIKNAISNYRDNFAVDVPNYTPTTSNINSSSLGYLGQYEFKAILNNMTGMNKKAVKDCLLKFQRNIDEFLESFNTSVSGIHISIFDQANAQQEAFKHMINNMEKKLRDATKEIIDTATLSIDTEIENLLLAQNQTVNTFNA